MRFENIFTIIIKKNFATPQIIILSVMTIHARKGRSENSTKPTGRCPKEWGHIICMSAAREWLTRYLFLILKNHLFKPVLSSPTHAHCLL